MKHILFLLSIMLFLSGCSVKGELTPIEEINETKEDTDIFLVYSEYKSQTNNGEFIESSESDYDLLTLKKDAYIKNKNYELLVKKKYNELLIDPMKDSVNIQIDFEKLFAKVNNNEFIMFPEKLTESFKNEIENNSKLKLFDKYMKKIYESNTISINRKITTTVSVYIFQVNTKETHQRALTSYCFQGQKFEISALRCVEKNDMRLF